MITIFKKLPITLRFLFVGGINTFISYSMFFLLTLLLGKEKYQTALFFSFLLSSLTSFTLQKLYVFQSKGKWITEYARCLISWGISYAINALLLEICVKAYSLNIYIAQVISITFTTIITFILFKYFAFKKREEI